MGESKKILVTKKQLFELRSIVNEEKQLDKLTLPKFIVNSIKQHKTSLGDHPTFPPGDESSFEERLLLKRFNEVGKAVIKISDLEQSDKNYLISRLTSYIDKAKSIESNIRGELEKICYEYVCDQFNISYGELNIECTLKDTITPDKEQNVEPIVVLEDDTEFGEVSEIDDLGKEIYKRRIIDSLIQGASVRLSSDYSTILNKIYELNPKLPELYYNIIALNDYLTFIKEVKPEANNLGGYVSVNLSSTEPSIKSEAIIFPVLVFETIKGVMELMSSHGLPKSIRDAEYVIGKADFSLAENWDKRFGVGLYDLLTKNIINKKLIPSLFVELISLDVDTFNNRLKEIFASTKKGKYFINHLERQIEREQNFSEIDSMIGGNNGDNEYFEAEDFNLGMDNDGYFSINELGGINDIDEEAVALGNIGDIAFDMPAFGDKESLNHKDMIKNGQAKWNIREKVNIVKKNFLNEEQVLIGGHPLFYHGTTDESLIGKSGIHVGTKMAATQALQAKIGVPAEGEWDGTREYGKTLLAGKRTLEKKNYVIGYDPIMNFNATEDVPEDDYYPHQRKKRAVYFSTNDLIPLNCKPIVFECIIVGEMLNTYDAPYTDAKANEMMNHKLELGNAKKGCYYINIWEDEGSISAVVPDGSFIKEIPITSN